MAAILEKFLNNRYAPYLFGLIGWIVMWNINGQLSFLQKTMGVNFVFLPAGIRTLSVFIFGYRGAIGVFIGNVITNYFYYAGDQSISQLSFIGLCFISAFSGYAMMVYVCKRQNILASLDNLTPSNILYIVISQGLLSATLHEIIYYAENLDDARSLSMSWLIIDWLAILTGDIIGSMILMLCFAALFAKTNRN